jgi:hypothetical protein
MSRYELRTGRFGPYFYDTQNELDLDNQDILKKLTALDKYVKQDVGDILQRLDSKPNKSQLLFKERINYKAMEYYGAHDLTIKEWATFLDNIIKEIQEQSMPDLEILAAQQHAIWKDSHSNLDDLIPSVPYNALSKMTKEYFRSLVRRFVLGAGQK